MPGQEEVTFPLKKAYRDFAGIILSLSNEQFLSSMNGWSPRDIVAHLIGWNNLMIEASLSILRGKPPTYYDDTPNDYSNINSGFTARYSSHSKQELLAELKSSMEGFETFILALPDGELVAHHGVRHYSGSPATVSKIIASLAGDYQYHTQQIREWLNKS
ncbi:MAG: ClbS/DfsB family four-helix bundle protein [Chloroflexi bacterium]|nr:ClbS/DfsB family four-helix bundle protein [Chloroflexota bacterium]